MTSRAARWRSLVKGTSYVGLLCAAVACTRSVTIEGDGGGESISVGGAAPRATATTSFSSVSTTVVATSGSISSSTVVTVTSTGTLGCGTSISGSDAACSASDTCNGTAQRMDCETRPDGLLLCSCKIDGLLAGTCTEPSVGGKCMAKLIEDSQGVPTLMGTCCQAFFATGGATAASSSGTAQSVGAGPVQRTTIDCVGTPCDETTEKCCIPVPENGPTGCIPQGGTCPGFVAQCSTAANCPSGQVCCMVALIPNISTVCVSSCEPGPQICETDAECVTGKCSTGAGIGDQALRWCQ